MARSSSTGASCLAAVVKGKAACESDCYQNRLIDRGEEERDMTMIIWLGAMVLLLAGAEFSQRGYQMSLVCNIAGIALFILWLVIKEIQRRNP